MTPIKNLDDRAHILYVEDDETLGYITRDNLELHGYLIRHISDGTDALAAIKHENFDLAILDIMLPGVDGFTLAAEIRKRDRDVPILFLSAKPLKEDRLRGFSLGADDYVTKPFSIEELTYKINVFLKRRRVTGSDDQNRGFGITDESVDHGQEAGAIGNRFSKPNE